MSLDLLTELLSLCKAGVYIEVNAHRDYYEPVGQFLKDRDQDDGIDPDVLHQMMALDTIVEVAAYPNTPVSFYKVYHYDLNVALQTIIDHIKARRDK